MGARVGLYGFLLEQRYSSQKVYKPNMRLASANAPVFAQISEHRLRTGSSIPCSLPFFVLSHFRYTVRRSRLRASDS